MIRDLADLRQLVIEFPLIAKPLAEGTGKGIDSGSKVIDRASLRESCEPILAQFLQPALVERFLPGREFTVGIVGTGRAAEVVGTLEIILCSNAEPDVYSYRNKEQSESVVECRLVHASSDPQVAEAERIALAAWRVVGGRDAGRLDLRCDAGGSPQLMEINPLAGLHPTYSDLPILWSALGHNYVALIGRIVESARERMGAGVVSRMSTDTVPDAGSGRVGQ